MASTGADLKVQKAAMRKELKAALKATSPDNMAAQSEEIAKHLLPARFFQDISTVAVYLTAPRLREVDTNAIVADLLQPGSSRRCYVPVVVDSASNMRFLHIADMESLVEMPPFGILEPTPEYPDGTPREDVLNHSGPLDLILLPGLGFDKQGGRLGRGGGYYDKFLEKIMLRATENGWPRPKFVALAFREQLVDVVPMTAQDQRIDFLVTADGIHAFGE
eukprot:CAMPEP_0117695114 /NCGR_PEP_ID=MMETSP0804-20121206/27937_1 /TAXON_ID=1074897 /ORGANISM="Tetraselmis astigmatica, Strain CCMP880" /LENGTH=219 /DNA_ID=CAMNT_0005509105 /DNA_START=307 /DNA_END=966 /DNA_ORIENTATION=-